MDTLRIGSRLGLALVLLGACAVQAASPPPPSLSELERAAQREAERCARTKVFGATRFQGRTYAEIPDIKAPELQRANTLISVRCLQQAEELLQAYVAEHPDDYQTAAVVGRYVWAVSGDEPAEQIFNEVLAKHPRFASAQVLLAGVYYERNDLIRTKAIIDEVAPYAPTDAWVYLNQLRLQARADQPPKTLGATLMAIARHPGFSGNVRQEATWLGSHLRGEDNNYEVYQRLYLEFDSYWSMACKRAQLALLIIHQIERASEVIKLLETPNGEIENCGSLTPNRVTLAQAYLLEAAKIAPGPTAANEKLVNRARELLDGNFSQLVSATMNRPSYPVVKPFLEDESHVDEPDADGYTPLCKAVYTRNPGVLKEQLDQGANPMQPCGYGQLPIRTIMDWSGTGQAPELYEMTRLLLEAGADPGDLSDCRAFSACRTLLLPLLEAHAASKK